MAILSFKLSENLFIRDPQETPLGRNMVQESIRLIDKLGFEEFTFRKLALAIHSTEASVYRYFDNKHKLLIYLIDWYWTWLEYQIDFQINNIKAPEERLKVCIKILAEQKSFDPGVAYVDEAALQRIVTAEFEKTFLTKQVDADNKDGLFLPYKSLCKKVAAVVREVNPQFDFPHALVSTVMLTLKHQLFYAEHLPSLTDIKYDPKKHHKKLYQFLETLIFKTISR
ncbi:MAG TPA: TetR/AcrR family transcriptional regulator [Ohtaekwangia sp.]